MVVKARTLLCREISGWAGSEGRGSVRRSTARWLAIAVVALSVFTARAGLPQPPRAGANGGFDSDYLGATRAAFEAAYGAPIGTGPAYRVYRVPGFARCQVSWDGQTMTSIRLWRNWFGRKVWRRALRSVGLSSRGARAVSRGADSVLAANYQLMGVKHIPPRWEVFWQLPRRERGAAGYELAFSAGGSSREMRGGHLPSRTRKRAHVRGTDGVRSSTRATITAPAAAGRERHFPISEGRPEHDSGRAAGDASGGPTRRGS